MKATIVRALGKIFIKSDYNEEFISELKKSIPVKNRRWNGAFPMGFFYRLMSGIPREKLLDDMEFMNNIKSLFDSGNLKRTWEVEEIHLNLVRDLCLKHFLEVCESEDGKSMRVLSSDTMSYDRVNNYQEGLIRMAEEYRAGEIVGFDWDFEGSGSSVAKKDELNFQFYSPHTAQWLYGTSFSYGPKRYIGPSITSEKRTFKINHMDDGTYRYIWEGRFFCPQNTLFKFKGVFYLVVGENKLKILGEKLDGWSRANQIIEYQKILLRLSEINSDMASFKTLFCEKPLEIFDMVNSRPLSTTLPEIIE